MILTKRQSRTQSGCCSPLVQVSVVQLCFMISVYWALLHTANWVHRDLSEQLKPHVLQMQDIHYTHVYYAVGYKDIMSTII